MLKTLLLGTMISCLSATFAVAQKKDSHFQAAEKLLTAMGLEDSFNKTLEASFEAGAKTMAEDLQQPFVKAMKKFSDIYMKWDVIKPKLAELYKSEFTEAELNSLTKFYETPVGKKTIEKMPVLSAKGMEIGQNIVLENRAELQQIMEKYIKQ